MKPLNPLFVLVIFILLLSFSSSSAQDYTRWHLPEGAIASFGKGAIDDIVYFPDWYPPRRRE